MIYWIVFIMVSKLEGDFFNNLIHLLSVNFINNSKTRNVFQESDLQVHLPIKLTFFSSHSEDCHHICFTKLHDHSSLNNFKRHHASHMKNCRSFKLGLFMPHLVKKCSRWPRWRSEAPASDQGRALLWTLYFLLFLAFDYLTGN